MGSGRHDGQPHHSNARSVKASVLFADMNMGNLVARCPRGQPSTRTAWAHGALAVPELPTDPHRAATLGSLAPTDDAGPGAVDCVAVGAGLPISHIAQATGLDDKTVRSVRTCLTSAGAVTLIASTQAMPSSSIASFARPDRYALMAALALLASLVASGWQPMTEACVVDGGIARHHRTAPDGHELSALPTDALAVHMHFCA